jgi:hypothetical protein
MKLIDAIARGTFDLLLILLVILLVILLWALRPRPEDLLGLLYLLEHVGPWLLGLGVVLLFCAALGYRDDWGRL